MAVNAVLLVKPCTFLAPNSFCLLTKNILSHRPLQLKYLLNRLSRPSHHGRELNHQCQCMSNSNKYEKN